MNPHHVRALFAVLLLAPATLPAYSQAKQKPGLYDVATTMNWLQSPMPAGMKMPPGMANPFAGQTYHNQFCLTQEQIDRYGGAPPQDQKRGRQECKTSDLKISGNSMTAKMICTGQMSGVGDIASSWTGDTAKSKTHFKGTMKGGSSQESMPVEWINDSTWTYKGPDCGDVKPIEVPKD
jgi:hypothetical protein